MDENKIIIYNTEDGKNSVKLFAKDGTVWLNQQSLAELFDTSVPNISMHTQQTWNAVQTLGKYRFERIKAIVLKQLKIICNFAEIHKNKTL
ncbi:MAG: hypothetical protein LBF01_03665 [Bacteroidales bacterium]|jgi:hypothetical protein|nr:hypothetical protein [Bacteroidales bacterium]